MLCYEIKATTLLFYLLFFFFFFFFFFFVYHRDACSYSFGLVKPSHIVVTKEKDELTTKKKNISGSIPLYSIDSNLRFLVRAHLADAT